MKRIFTTLALLTAFASGASAQRSCDIEVMLVTPTTDTPVTTVLGCGTTDSLRMNVIAINNGPGSLVKNDTFWYNSPLSDVNYVRGFLVDTTYGVGDTLLAGNITMAYSQIKKLWGSSGSGLAEVPKASFNTNNTIYAAVFSCDRIGGYGGSAVTDPDEDNNADVGLVKINCGTGIDDLFGNSKMQTLATYPNPAYDKVSFKYNFNNNAATVRITDIAGRIVLSRDFGKQSGEKELSMDITALKNGMYYLELITDDKRAISKITVQK